MKKTLLIFTFIFSLPRSIIRSVPRKASSSVIVSSPAKSLPGISTSKSEKPLDPEKPPVCLPDPPKNVIQVD